MTQLVTYYNDGTLPLQDAVGLPYTAVNLAFLLTSPATPFELELAGGIAAVAKPPTLTETTIQAIRELQTVGKKVLISFGGATMDFNTYREIAGQEARLAQSIVDFVIENNLDGVDIDWEDTAAFEGTAGYDGVEFLVNLTMALRDQLPPDAILTHAPQAPYLDHRFVGPDNGYIAVMDRVGDQIDWLNVQFYNNRDWEGPANIIESYEKFSVLPGVTPEQLLIGLPVTPADAGSGFIPIDEIITEVIQPIESTGELGGMMNWQFSSDVGGVWAIDIGNALGL